jgi:hypothetical protein
MYDVGMLVFPVWVDPVSAVVVWPAPPCRVVRV